MVSNPPTVAYFSPYTLIFVSIVLISSVNIILHVHSLSFVVHAWFYGRP